MQQQISRNCATSHLHLSHPVTPIATINALVEKYRQAGDFTATFAAKYRVVANVVKVDMFRKGGADVVVLSLQDLDDAQSCCSVLLCGPAHGAFRLKGEASDCLLNKIADLCVLAFDNNDGKVILHVFDSFIKS